MDVKPLVVAALTIISVACQPKSSPLNRELRTEIDNLFQRWNSSDSPGCAIALMQSGEVVYRGFYGRANLDHGIPINSKTAFNVASVAKQFTAAIALLLEREGKLSFDDPIRKHLPDLPAYVDPVTVRHLIHHQSGLPDVAQVPYVLGKAWLDLVTGADLRRLLLLQDGLAFAPEARFSYAEINYIVLAWILEEVSGESLNELASTRIFEQLGMTSTKFVVDHSEIIPNRAFGYEMSRHGVAYRHTFENTDYAGHSNLWTTIDDLTLWLNDFERPKGGGAGFIQQLVEAAPLASAVEGSRYALGLFVDEYMGLRRIWHAGAGTHYSMVAVFPEKEFTVACLCNVFEPNPRVLAMRVTDAYLRDTMDSADDSPPDREEAAPTDENLAGYEGLYWSSEGRGARLVSEEDGSLVLTVVGENGRRLQSLGGGRFVDSRGIIDVRFVAKDGQERHDLLMTYNGVDHWLLNWKGPGLSELAPGKEEEYLGVYYSDELDASFRITTVGGQLLVERPWPARPMHFRPILPDVFESQVGGVTFERGGSGLPGAFVLIAEGDLQLRFRRLGSENRR